MDLASTLVRDLGLTAKHGLPPPELLRTLARAQDGQFALRQATSLGLKASKVRALRDRGDVLVLRRGVAGFTVATEPDPAVTAYLACWPHAVISHASAAGYHGLARVEAPEEPHVSVAKGVSGRVKGIAVHHVRDLDSSHILKVGTLRYTSVALTVCYLSTADDPWESLSILDDAVAGGASRRWINSVAKARVQGRDGVALIERATRTDAAAEFRSWLERAGAHIFRLGGLPAPQGTSPCVMNGDA